MPTLTIDNQTITVADGATLLEAAQQLGIVIPTLCHAKGLAPNTTCLVCLVAIQGRDTLVPACSALATDDMVVFTDTPAVHQARREAIELLLSEHTGDCLAPCQLVCPFQINIPLMIRHIQKGDFNQALTVVAQQADAHNPELCRTCRKPCETVCRRSRHDNPLAIASLVQTSQALATLKPQSRSTQNQARLKSTSLIQRLTHQELTVFLDHAAPHDRIASNNDGTFTKESATQESQRCLHCDCRKADNCALQNLAHITEAKQSAFSGERLTHEAHHFPEYIFEPAKCIRCGICIALCEKAGIHEGFAFFNRGFDVQPGVPFNRYKNADLKNIIGECIAKCPTGALSRKD